MCTDNNNHQTFLLTDNANKLYQLPNNWGLSYTGTASFGNIPISSILTTYIQETTFNQTLDPETWLTQLTLQIQKHHLNSSDNCILLLCGYQNKQQFLLTTNTATPNIKLTDTKTPGFTYAGASDTLEPIINMLPFDYAKFPTQELVECLYFLNKTVAKLQHYQQRPQVVSNDCDILVIHPKTSYWAQNFQ